MTFAVIPPELIALAVAVVVIGVVAAGIALLVSRYGKVREDKGEASEKVQAYEKAIVTAADREGKARKERGKSHAEWKREGRKRREKRARPRGRS